MEIEKCIEFGKINAIFNVNIEDIKGSDKFSILSIKESYQPITVRKYILHETSCLDKRLLASLKLVHLEEDILNKKMNVLSISEKLKIELAILLIQNVGSIILDKFDIYFMEKELLFFKKLFKKLVKKYQKTFIFLNSDITFLFDLADKIVVKENKREYFVLENPTFYENELYSLVEKPKIVEFVNYLNDSGKKILPYTDLKELLKAIFREV